MEKGLAIREIKVFAITGAILCLAIALSGVFMGSKVKTETPTPTQLTQAKRESITEKINDFLGEEDTYTIRNLRGSKSKYYANIEYVPYVISMKDGKVESVIRDE